MKAGVLGVLVLLVYQCPFFKGNGRRGWGQAFSSLPLQAFPVDPRLSKTPTFGVMSMNKAFGSLGLEFILLSCTDQVATGVFCGSVCCSIAVVGVSIDDAQLVVLDACRQSFLPFA